MFVLGLLNYLYWELVFFQLETGITLFYIRMQQIYPLLKAKQDLCQQCFVKMNICKIFSLSEGADCSCHDVTKLWTL